MAERAYKYRIYPNKKQQELIRKTFGCTRYVYNHYLDKQKTDKTNYTYVKCVKDLTQLKKEVEWLKEVDSVGLQTSLKDLDVAYKNFFSGRSGYPKFKSRKNRHQSYRTSFTNNNIAFMDKHIKLPKLGLVKVRDKQVPQGRILNATIS